MSQPHSRLHDRLLGLACTLGLVAFVGGVPALLLEIDAVPSAGAFTWSSLTSPDDGTLVLAVIKTVVWVAWAIFAVSVLLSLAARVGRVRAPHLPGLAAPQLATDRLVAAAALLFVAVPAVAVSTVTPRALAYAVPTETPAATPVADSPANASLEVTGSATPATPQTGGKVAVRTTPYTVKPHEGSWWKLAKSHLGNGHQYKLLQELNPDVFHGQSGFIEPGTVIQLPVTESYLVQTGDTLSRIAEENLGDANDYPEIFAASREITQPGGAHLTDPDLIRPGWKLTIPMTQTSLAGVSSRHAQPKRPHASRPPTATSAAPGTRGTPSMPSTLAAVPPIGPEQSSNRGTDGAGRAEHPASTTTVDHSLPGWLLPGLTGAGALLGGSLLLRLRQRRRTQLRYRRPGRVLAPPPVELRHAEKTAQASGSITAPRMEDLDHALRGLGTARDEAGAVPRLVTASLHSDHVDIRLAEPVQLSTPWSGQGQTWSTPLAPLGQRAEGEAPYPMLASIGQAADGSLVLVNLEELGSIAVTGDKDKAAGLGRHLTAELALSHWSSLVEIDTVGIGEELAPIDPLRVHHHPTGDLSFLQRLASDLETEDDTVEVDQYRVLIAAGADGDIDAVDHVAAIITKQPGGTGAAVVSIRTEATGSGIEMHISATGRLRIDALDLEVTAAGLTPDEARACAALVDLTREIDDAPTPGADTVCDAGGALTPGLTEPRPAGPAGERSLLPDAAHAYVETASTTTEDVEQLAPLTRPGAAQTVSEHDPDLDDDLARWEAPVVLAPKLTLLGPVSARTAGEAKDIAHRKPFYIELLAFLALNPRGVTTSEVADAFGLRPDRARSDLSVVRHWLGHDPRTGKPHLPSARAQQKDGVRGTPLYIVHGVLNDLDLFRRLRARGQSRGADGIEDLVTALRLVSGEPFSDLRATGWTWLLDGERIDHVMTCAIVDVAHIVTTHALTIEDFALARFSAETSYRVAPYDEVSRLDLIAVASATGHTEAAERQLIEGILNRSDDHLGPTRPSERTEAILRRRGPNKPT